MINSEITVITVQIMIFIHISLQMIIYLLIELETTRKFN
jgi:hypothetical protein